MRLSEAKYARNTFETSLTFWKKLENSPLPKRPLCCRSSVTLADIYSTAIKSTVKSTVICTLDAQDKSSISSGSTLELNVVGGEKTVAEVKEREFCDDKEDAEHKEEKDADAEHKEEKDDANTHPDELKEDKKEIPDEAIALSDDQKEDKKEIPDVAITPSDEQNEDKKEIPDEAIAPSDEQKEDKKDIPLVELWLQEQKDEIELCPRAEKIKKGFERAWERDQTYMIKKMYKDEKKDYPVMEDGETPAWSIMIYPWEHRVLARKAQQSYETFVLWQNYHPQQTPMRDPEQMPAPEPVVYEPVQLFPPTPVVNKRKGKGRKAKRFVKWLKARLRV